MTTTPNNTNTAKEDRYNGWTNYETWAVAFWIANDQSAYAHWRSEAARQTGEATFDRMFRNSTQIAHEAVQHNLAGQLKDDAAKAVHDIESPFYTDLLLIALNQVNWLELAENLLIDLVA